MSEAVVFLPSMMSDARVFGPQIADLSRDFAVMTAPVTQGERIEEIASGLLDVLPKRCALVGLGFGGIIAMEVIRRAPDRVNRIAFMATTPLADTPHEAGDRDPQIARVRAGRFEDVLREELHPEALADSPYKPEIQALMMDMAKVLGPEIFIRQTRALQRRRDQQAVLRKIAVPSLVLCGALDTLCPVKRHSFMAEMIPGADLAVLQDAGHMPTLEAPDATSDALRAWLAKPLMLR